MPTVPQAQNTVQIRGLPSARSTVNYSPEAFGAGQARGLQALAETANDFARREQEKQDTAALMSAERKLQAWQNQALFAPETGAYSQKGQSSFGLPERIMPEWDKQVGEVEAGLNERQLRVFRERAGNMRISMERDILRHVGAESESFQQAETKALVATRVETAMLYWTDPKRFETELREAQSAFLVGNPDIPPAAQKIGLTQIESTARAAVVGKMLERDPLEAQRYFDTHAASMTEADRAQAERLIRPAWADAEGRRQLAAIKTSGAPASQYVPKTDNAAAIKAAADELGIDPVDLATVISYETGGTFSPDQPGPTTKWGQHRGLIQFGEPQRAKYGVKPGQTVQQQMPAVVAYLRDAGVKPGMGILDVYSAINAGAPGRYNASDEAAGGAPGTVADKVNNQMAGHRKRAQAMFDSAGAPVATASAGSGPKSKAEVLAGINAIPNPQVRAAALSAFKMEIDVEELAKAEREEAFVESINTKIESADPTANLRSVLSPQEYAWAAEQGKLPAWEQRMANRLAGTEPKTDPNLLDALQTVLSRAENGDAAAIAEVRKMDTTKLYSSLDRRARDYVQERRGALLSGLAKGQETPDFASEDELLNTEVFDKLGISKNPQKAESDDDKKLRAKFMESYWAAVDTGQKEKGRKLNSGEKQQIMRDLLQPFARTVKDSFLYFDTIETKRGFEIGQVPAVDRQQITSAYRQLYGTEPSAEQITAAYLRAQGYAPQLDTE